MRKKMLKESDLDWIEDVSINPFYEYNAILFDKEPTFEQFNTIVEMMLTTRDIDNISSWTDDSYGNREDDYLQVIGYHPAMLVHSPVSDNLTYGEIKDFKYFGSELKVINFSQLYPSALKESNDLDWIKNVPTTMPLTEWVKLKGINSIEELYGLTVLLREDSEWWDDGTYEYGKDEYNPHYIEGVIFSSYGYDYDDITPDGMPIGVEWANGKTNSYDLKDLDVVVEQDKLNEEADADLQWIEDLPIEVPYEHLVEGQTYKVVLNNPEEIVEALKDKCAWEEHWIDALFRTTKAKVIEKGKKKKVTVDCDHASYDSDKEIDTIILAVGSPVEHFWAKKEWVSFYFV